MGGAKMLPWSAMISVTVISASIIGSAFVVADRVTRVEVRVGTIEADIKTLVKSDASRDYLEDKVKVLEDRVHGLETGKR